MTEEIQTEEQKPYITIDDVQVYIEDLPEEGQQIFSRLQRLNQKKAVPVSYTHLTLPTKRIV